MGIEEAKAMLDGLPAAEDGAQRWADLGCGEGTFTRALARLLPAGSSIQAWDRDADALRALPAKEHGTLIAPAAKDFTQAELPQHMDGILMANALHYVAGQAAFAQRVHSSLLPGGLFVLAEYDITTPVPRWVPFPIDALHLEEFLSNTGFTDFTLLARRPSRFGRGDLYTAFARKADRA